MNILLPQTGLYKLMIYLEPESASEEKIYVVSYLLECIKPFSQRLVFQNYGDKLGLQSMRKSKCLVNITQAYKAGINRVLHFWWS